VQEATSTQSFDDTARRLAGVLDDVVPKLRALDAAFVAQPREPGKWSRKEVLGHLVDSAANNHQRFVRAALIDATSHGELSFPDYEQARSVALQGYQAFGWDGLVALWEGYNRFLAHVLHCLPESCADVRCAIGAKEPVALAFLAEDYVVHLQHHLGQVL